MTGSELQFLDRQALASLLQRPRLKCLLEALNGAGEETRIVGGAVRNALLGRPVTEVDCATTAVPDITIRRAAEAGFKSVPTGIDHGTVTVVVEGEPFEVTTLREDVETDGRHAVVRFGRDFRADAQRRDFTINALSLGLDGRLHDETNGVTDLEHGYVRFIGEPRSRIREDYLRILRFFRFHSEYAEGPPDAQGLAAAGAERAGLEQLSRERIRVEVLKILMSRRATDTLEILFEHGFLTPLFGGAVEQGRFVRVSPVASAAIDRLSALAVMTREDAERLRDRLRLSNAEHDAVTAYADLVAALKSRPVDALEIRRLVADHGVEAVIHARGALAGEPRPVLSDQAKEALERFGSGVDPIPVFPLRGADLMASGLQPGPEIGALLARARRLWREQGCPMGENVGPNLASLILPRG